jgi:Ca-activated chloride channel family protein
MRPEWLWSLVPALILMLLLWRQRGRRGGWSDVIAPELLAHLVGERAGARSTNLLPLIFIGWLVAALAASGPSWQKIPQPIHQKQDALVLVLDLSYSMKSGDIVPSRLDRARQKLLDLLEQRREGQTGLIAYAGDAHIVTPLTDDTPTIANLLPALHPDMMPVPGSDPAAAVAQAVELLHSAGIRQGKILLVTDGVADKDRKGIVKALKGTGIHLGIMGVGTATGAPVPLPRGGFLKDQAGAIVMPSLDDKNLRSIATASGGRYIRMQIDDSDLDYLLTETTLPERELTLALDRTADTWDDQGYLFILVLLPLVLGLFRRGWVLSLLPLLLPLMLLVQPQPANAQSWGDLWLTPDQQGRRALQRGDNEAASALFENQDWAGTAAYRSGDYDAATGHFSENNGADGWYNRGNALARSGELDDAIAAYKESLALQPDRADARENLALLEQLKEQQEQEQQQEQQDKDQKNEDQDQQQEQDQEQDQEQQQGDQQQSDQESEQDKDQQQDENQDQQERDSESGNEDQQSDQEQQQSEPQQDEPGEGEQEQQAEVALADPQEQERDQAMEQWLRRVPDDPSGLLREKFRYESRQRQEQGNRKDDETYW